MCFLLTYRHGHDIVKANVSRLIPVMSESAMRSDVIKRGLERAPHRALLRAMGLSPRELEQPFVGVVNSFSEVIPGHKHLQTISQAVKEGVYSAGGTPFEVNTIAVCDGIAMNHPGMRYSLPSRELIADSVEILAQAHAFDALVFIASCDKIVPGMLLAAVRLNIPSIFCAIVAVVSPLTKGYVITISHIGRLGSPLWSVVTDVPALAPCPLEESPPPEPPVGDAEPNLAVPPEPPIISSVNISYKLGK